MPANSFIHTTILAHKEAKVRKRKRRKLLWRELASFTPWIINSSFHPLTIITITITILLPYVPMWTETKRQKKKKKIVPEPKEWRQTVSSNDESSISPLPHGYTSNENWFVFWSCWPLISWCFLFPGSPPLGLWSHPFSLLTQHILPGQPSSLIIPIVVVF